MADFSVLERYIFTEYDQGQEGSKHVLYRLNLQDVTSAENKLGRPFPEELRQLYLHIGYGFLCCSETEVFDRILDPESVANFNLGKGIYASDPLAHEYAQEYRVADRLAFFEVSETAFLTLSLAEEDAAGRCPIYYFDTCVANSLEEFITRMDREPDYYLAERGAARSLNEPGMQEAQRDDSVRQPQGEPLPQHHYGRLQNSQRLRRECRRGDYA